MVVTKMAMSTAYCRRDSAPAAKPLMVSMTFSDVFQIREVAYQLSQGKPSHGDAVHCLLERSLSVSQR